MPRKRRSRLDAPYFHVVNRSIRRFPIFTRRSDYRAFLKILGQGLERYPVTLLAYCLLSNHWHLIVEPAGTTVLSRFMQWVTATHAVRWHRHHKTLGQGAVYQGRFHSTPLAGVADLVGACRYVERNALAAGLVPRAENWPWCSLSDRQRPRPTVPLRRATFLGSQAWIDHVNAVISPADRRLDIDPDFLNIGAARRATRATSGTRKRKPVENTSDPL